jgi:CubicO group peptidase (beta-lactamase class C family)
MELGWSMRYCLLIPTLCLLIAESAFAQASETPARSAPDPRSGFADKVEQYMERLEAWGFSGVLLVAKNDEVLLRKGYGLADRATNRRVAVDTPYTVGSITKQFTAAAIMKLRMAGKLNVQDRISKHVPNVPPDKSEITLHHLLTHTAGFPGALGDDYEPCTRDEIVAQAMHCKLQGRPGEEYSYSNVGYSLLGAIVETVSGQSYEAYLVDQLFKPAGMTRTGYLLPKFANDALPHGYTSENEDWGTSLSHRWMPDGPSWHLRANGGVLSTVDDMFKWHQALNGDGILSGEARKQMFQQQVSEGPGSGSHYGYGWVVARTPRNTTVIMHNGGNGIFFADCRRYIDEGIFYFIASNAPDFGAIQVSDVLPRIIFGMEYVLPPTVAAVDSATLERHAGKYKLPTGGILTVEAKNGGLTIRGDGSDALGLLTSGNPEGPDKWKSISDRTKDILGSADRGDFAPLQKAFGGRMSIDELKQLESEHRRQEEAEKGKYLSFEVLGSTRGPEDAVFTYARRKFERGDAVIRLRWEQDELAGIRDVNSVGTARFMPQSASEFSSFSLNSPFVGQMRTEQDAGGMYGLVFRTPAGEIKTKRAE